MRRLLCILTLTSLALWSAPTMADLAFDDPCETQNLEDGAACVDENGIEGTCQGGDCVPSDSENNDANNDAGEEGNNDAGEEGDGDEGDGEDGATGDDSDDDSGCASVGNAGVPVGSIIIGLGLALFLGRTNEERE